MVEAGDVLDTLCPAYFSRLQIRVFSILPSCRDVLLFKAFI